MDNWDSVWLLHVNYVSTDVLPISSSTVDTKLTNGFDARIYCRVYHRLFAFFSDVVSD